MDIKSKVVSFLSSFLTVFKNFFLEQDNSTRQKFSKYDLADIFVALCPAAVFGCLLFGFRAVLVLAITSFIPVSFDFLWNFIFKKEKKINWQIALGGIILGMSLSSRLNVLLVLAVSIGYAVLCKFVFSGKELFLVFPVLIARTVFSIIFYGAFQVYAIPFMNKIAETGSMDYLFINTSFIPSAKYLFFGIHSGNIGETSVLMMLLGLIYLMLRKIINPVIPVCFVGSLAVLSLIFGRYMSISLLGGGLFFSAFIFAIDYSFKTTPRYKKIVFGLLCGVLTFVLREIFKSEAVALAVLISYIIMYCLNRKNIKFVVGFFAKFDYKGFVKKITSKFKAKVKE